jgi:DNA-binding winged helix-turn-helix (wHTH) protein/TolB-like protein
LFGRENIVIHHFALGVVMETTDAEKENSFAIGSIIVEPSRNIITHGTNVFALEPKIMDVLQYLALRQGQVCSRDDIIAAVWQVEYGADESLTRAISVIRKTLDKAGGEASFIQTIPKRGYSLQETVSKIDPLNAKPAEFSKPSSVGSPNAIAKQSYTPHSNIMADDINDETPNPRGVFNIANAKGVGLVFLFIIGMAGVFIAMNLRQPADSFGTELAVSPYGRSVAIIPFVDISEDNGYQYFSDGVSQELSNELKKIKSLRIVVPRIGAVFDDNTMSYKDIGEELKVSHIIHGSVRTHQDKARITAVLINTVDNSQVWSSNYDGVLDNVFELQNHVASDIGLELSLIFSVNNSETIDLEDVLPTPTTEEQN